MNKLINYIKSLMIYLTIAEDKRSLSISNILVWVVIIKIAINPIDAQAIVLLIGALGNYIHRRTTKKSVEKTEEIKKDNDEIQ